MIEYRSEYGVEELRAEDPEVENEDEGKCRGRRPPGIRMTLLDERKIFLTRSINARVAHRILSELFYLESKDPDKEIGRAHV